jgi:hypothetical protein
MIVLNTKKRRKSPCLAKFFVLAENCHTEVREVHTKKNLITMRMKIIEEEETKELNHFWAGSNALISHTMPLI